MRPGLKAPFVYNSQVNTKCDSTNSSHTIICRHDSSKPRTTLAAISEYLGYLDLATNAGQQSFLDTFALETPHTRFHGKWLNSQHMPVSHLRSVVMSAELHKQMCVY
ncbi:hypothetical protein BDR06DRAFT_14776 [Suillus hirtellus]|nr:hypothetical protein BDR06DRAFT_14776 [Suillus hirtellus]